MIPVKIHQLLHGYRSGHGQIAGSIRLDHRDSELITRLSDLSGSLSSGISISTYLTVYRLPSRKFYALARTWPDQEAPRAGCVLTHTLLVPLSEWKTLPNVRVIDQLFRNPRLQPGHDFASTLDLLPDRDPGPRSGGKTDNPSAEAFVSRYFGKGLKPIVWFNQSEPEECLWRLLEHLWPALRAAFSCCSLSLQQRTLEDGPFDLLFAPSTVYSRFVKLSPEQLIEPSKDGRALKESEPWCQYWANALFSSDTGMPAKESELPVWNELGEDPTGIRKLSLIQELRLRAAESPMAGVGAIDVVESLARNPETATVLKRQVLSDAIEASEFANQSADSLTSLHLIEHRLRRESFLSVADEFEGRLTSATKAVTVKDPQAAIQSSDIWLTSSVTGARSSFVDGIMLGLREVALTDPSKLMTLKEHGDIAAEIFKYEPTYAPSYLRLGIEGARRTVADWMSSTEDLKALRTVRKAILASMDHLDDAELIRPLLRELLSNEVERTLSIVSKISDAFKSRAIQAAVIDQVSAIHPRLVREWASHMIVWSGSIAEVVAATYPQNPQGWSQVLDEDLFSNTQLAQIFVISLHDHLSNHRTREFIGKNSRVLKILLLAREDQANRDSVESLISKIIIEMPDIPLAKSEGILDLIHNLEDRPLFSHLLDPAMRSVISAFVSDGFVSQETKRFAASSSVMQWFATVHGSHLASILVRNCSGTAQGNSRSWQWLADAPDALYRKHNTILPEVCESLLPLTARFFADDLERSILVVLKRSKVESGYDSSIDLYGRMLRFSLDNVRLPVSGIVSEVFADVYAVAVENSRQPFFPFSIFGSHDWDKGKELRISVIDAFLRSNWLPGDLAISSHRAGILRKIVKRLHRMYKGDDYVRSMFEDLSLRENGVSRQVADHLKSLIADPNFYEEWD